LAFVVLYAPYLFEAIMLYGFIIYEDDLEMLLSLIWEEGLYCRRCNDKDGYSFYCTLPGKDGEAIVSLAKDSNVNVPNAFFACLSASGATDPEIIVKMKSLQNVMLATFKLLG